MRVSIDVSNGDVWTRVVEFLNVMNNTRFVNNVTITIEGDNNQNNENNNQPNAPANAPANVPANANAPANACGQFLNHRFWTMTSHLEETLECVICHDNIRNEHDLSLLKCGHHFHKHCILQMHTRTQSTACAVCRQE